jgi:hypothetical protein
MHVFVSRCVLIRLVCRGSFCVARRPACSPHGLPGMNRRRQSNVTERNRTEQSAAPVFCHQTACVRYMYFLWVCLVGFSRQPGCVGQDHWRLALEMRPICSYLVSLAQGALRIVRVWIQIYMQATKHRARTRIA